MEYLSSREAAEKWGLSLRYVQRLLHENRIPGAKKYGVSWLIPADSEKPGDLRKGGKSTPESCPEYCLMPLLYIRGGDMDAAFARCKSEEERALLEAEIAYMRGDGRTARRIATGIYKNTTHLQLKLGAGMGMALAANWLGDTAAWKQTVSEMQEMKVPPRLQMEKEFALSLVRAKLNGTGVYPKWLDIGAFTGLSPELFPAARWVYVSTLYTKWKEVDMLAVAEPLIAECRKEGSDPGEIYLRLLAATAYGDHNDMARAKEHLYAAADLALPLGFTGPFVEMWRMLQGVMDADFKVKYPRIASAIKKQARGVLENWTKVYNDVWEKPMASTLTPREFEACVLISRGMAVGEAAWRMGISKNTLKKYLNTAYNKLNVKEKGQLKELIHP